MWQEVIMAYFKILFWFLPGQTTVGQLASEQDFYHSTSQQTRPRQNEIYLYECIL
jgi:hypothetical protein